MRFPLASSLLLAALASISVAHADTINFASAAGSTTYTYVSGQGSLNGTGGLAVAYQNAFYAAPLAGSQWVSTSSTGGNGATGATNYTATVNLLAGERYTGSLSFMADDYANVLVNGVTVYTGSVVSSYLTPTTISLLSSYFTTGTNTITIQDNNVTGPAGADFAGTLTGTAVTPEPSSLMLLGTGVLGVAGTLRRRAVTA